ncbi:DUF397 domain-containing protein [Kitasatospora viridis]|uniref:Uncharacterized protein DUF397 n=1 Tax=Kitasatospora viridis TaxID=281105 RepID=A0A561SFK5_9ACTN|nr:DUF397 domain-containing protein [Kitasatospora viridis]TWF73661.1 uncharacterized protein DUF397 [Kitasatospora viridis]
MSNRAVFDFRKSSYSGSQGECVEVALNVPARTAVRDSKDSAGPLLVFRSDAWSAFVADVKAGDLPAR